MKQTVLFGALLLCLGLASCQCADPPPVGPVEDEQAHAVTEPDVTASDVQGLARV